MKFVSLGSGSSGNSYYLSTGNTSILVDAGLNVRTLKRHMHNLELDIENLDLVLITHDHADHIKAVGNLANELNKPIFATEPVHMGINRNYCVTSKLTEEHIRYIVKGKTIQVGDFMVTPFDVPHDSSDCVG